MTFSIIIPTFNRSDVLRRTMASVAQLDFAPEDFEILVVDNGSTDQTRQAFEVARAIAPKHNWRYFYEPMPGLLSGRHKGALESQADICAFIDDDVRLNVNWLHALKEAFHDPAVALVGGPSHPIYESVPPEWLQDFYSENDHARYCYWLSLLDGGEGSKEIHPGYVWGLNYAIRKKTLFDMGGFHPDCVPKPLQRFQGNGENGLSLKILKAGCKAMYHPQAAVQHEVPASRLTYDYFQKRAYYQGVSDSYNKIRAEGHVSQRAWSWKEPLRPAKRFVVQFLRSDDSALPVVKDHAAKAYKMGYEFHQREVRRDPRLLEWVLRKDYWDYALPIGWQNCLARPH
jgi:glucosyl-dolichyl phosphate glucuronosyltransferase